MDTQNRRVPLGLVKLRPGYVVRREVALSPFAGAKTVALVCVLVIVWLSLAYFSAPQVVP